MGSGPDKVERVVDGLGQEYGIHGPGPRAKSALVCELLQEHYDPGLRYPLQGIRRHELGEIIRGAGVYDFGPRVHDEERGEGGPSRRGFERNMPMIGVAVG